MDNHVQPNNIIFIFVIQTRTFRVFALGMELELLNFKYKQMYNEETKVQQPHISHADTNTVLQVVRLSMEEILRDAVSWQYNQ